MTIAFIVGTGRCGSTLVQEVLSRHPDVGFVSNVDNRMPLNPKGRWNNTLYGRLPPSLSGRTTSGRAIGWGGEGRASPKTSQRLGLAPSEAYALLSRRVSPLIARSDYDLTEREATPELTRRFRRFFEERARAQGRRAFLHHFTGWPRVGFIQAVFPEARFIHVVRDGRAVASSLLQASWWRGRLGPPGWGFGQLPARYAEEWEASGRSLALLAGLEWKVLIDAFDQAGAAIPPGQWRQVRYEDFVASPRASTSELIEFLGLSWNDEFERRFSNHQFKQSRSRAYEEELPAEDLGWLERSLASHLEHFGY